VQVLGKSRTAGSPCTSERGLSKKRSGIEMEVNSMEEGEMYDEAREEVVLGAMDYAMLKNKVMKSKKRVEGDTGLGFSSEEELMAQLRSVRSHKKPKKLVNDDIKQSSDTDKNVNKLQIHNHIRERAEEGSIQQVESEALNLGNDTINGKEDLGEGLKSNKKGNVINLRFRMYENI
jgi:hypothetical protein